MTAFRIKNSEAPTYSNYWDGCEHDGVYYDLENWNQDQFYEGEFFRNGIHGQGTCKWGGSGVYEGGFYSNFKEGYALLSLPNNSFFEGLFIRNRPFGPGILTHSNGRQDAGFWMGGKLVRLSRSVDCIIPRLAPTSAAKIKLLQFRRLIPLNENKNDSAVEIVNKFGLTLEYALTSLNITHDPRSFFFDNLSFEKAYFSYIREMTQEFNANSKEWESSYQQFEDEGEEEYENFEENSVPSHCLCSQQVFVMDYKQEEVTDICEKGDDIINREVGLLGYYTKYGTFEGIQDSINGEVEEKDQFKSKPLLSKIVSWNRNELCTEMLKQIFRHSAFEEKLNFKIPKLMLGARTAFRKTGEKEKRCLQFLKLCSLGPLNGVKELLCLGEISEELMDARGNNSLMFAAAKDQHDIIDLLLDYGVNVNSFNDEGLTPLNLCLLRRLAQANGISDWETAFLPTEISKVLDEGSHVEEWRVRESIQSLDRIFGDGTSINDSFNLRDENLQSSKDTAERTSHYNILFQPPSEGDKEVHVNYTTVLNTNKILGNISTGEEKSVNNKTTVLTSNKTYELEKCMSKSNKEMYLFDLSPEERFSGDTRKLQDGFLRRNKDGDINELEEGKIDMELVNRIKEIDKTIEKLLQRGADPNISEVPKPSIHLAVFTKDIHTVHNLLLYGANPDCQLYPNEGLLTPLHVLALIKPAPEFLSICELLLSFGANPEEETLPEFNICENEKNFLDTENGRTPLQLLSMRPDLNHADPEGHLIKMALLLAKVSNKRHYYKGHSCVTLAMIQGNVMLIEALLQSRLFDPNDVLGNDLGTALHVLVSTYFQIKTAYEESIKMCDILIKAGANPLKKFKTPKKLQGTCLDYGYREIEEEKNARKINGNKKTESKPEKIGVRDHLKDHVKVVEYLGKIVQGLTSGKDSDWKETSPKKKECKEKSRTEVLIMKASEKNKFKAKDKEKNDNEKERVTFKNSEEDVKQEKERDLQMRTSAGKGRRQMEYGDTNQDDEDEDEQKRKGKTVKKGDQKDDRRNEKSLRVSGANKKTKKKQKLELSGAKKRAKEQRTKHKNEKGAEQKPEKGEKGKGSRKAEDGAKSNLDVSKSTSGKQVSEMFPEKLRQSLLEMFGNCGKVDVNELLLPYVVLRDGDLYYRFHGKATKRKEQYSLI